MKKYFIDGEEVEFGSTVSITEIVTLDDETVKELVKEGILEVREVDDKKSEEENYAIFEKAVANMAKSLGWPYKKLDNIAKRMWEINPTYTIRLYLKAIAIELDKKYSDHIKNSKEFWMINFCDLSPLKVGTPTKFELKSYSFFRSEEDAILAINVVRNMYNYAKYGPEEASKPQD